MREAWGTHPDEREQAPPRIMRPEAKGCSGSSPDDDGATNEEANTDAGPPRKKRNESTNHGLPAGLVSGEQARNLVFPRALAYGNRRRL
jgi:hypothetical protein